jgi:hypothetical protein
MVTTKKPVKEAKAGFISMRATPEMYSAFQKNSSMYGGVSSVLRELISAFLQDRLTIQRPQNHVDLYDIGKKSK